MNWKERLKEEYTELTQRLAKLDSFLNKGNVMYDDGTLDDESLNLLWKQRAIMRDYQDILFERICHAGIKL